MMSGNQETSLGFLLCKPLWDRGQRLHFPRPLLICKVRTRACSHWSSVLSVQCLWLTVLTQTPTPYPACPRGAHLKACRHTLQTVTCGFAQKARKLNCHQQMSQYDGQSDEMLINMETGVVSAPLESLTVTITTVTILITKL